MGKDTPGKIEPENSNPSVGSFGNCPFYFTIVYKATRCRRFFHKFDM
jgi:hypothetical protein